MKRDKGKLVDAAVFTPGQDGAMNRFIGTWKQPFNEVRRHRREVKADGVKIPVTVVVVRFKAVQRGA